MYMAQSDCTYMSLPIVAQCQMQIYTDFSSVYILCTTHSVVLFLTHSLARLTLSLSLCIYVHITSIMSDV